MRLAKQIIRVGGSIEVPQGGPFRPLGANLSLNELDWFVAAKRRKGGFEAVHYRRLADDVVITGSGHHTKRGGAERARQRLRKQIAPLDVELVLEKTKMMSTLNGEAFGFLGFDLCRVGKPSGEGNFILMIPKKKPVRRSRQRFATSSRVGVPLRWGTW
jgi:RNA-directed DNA polymerase